MRGCGTHGSSGGSPRLVWLGLNSPVSSSTQYFKLVSARRTAADVLV